MQTLTIASLSQMIANQCPGISETQAQAYVQSQLDGTETTYEWVHAEERDAAQLEEADIFEVSMALDRVTLIVSDINFGARANAPGADEDNLLATVKNIHFKSCHFHTDNIAPNNFTAVYHFEDCKFLNLWKQPLPDLSFNQHVLYKECIFEQGVELTGSVSGTGCQTLFSDCRISQLALLKMSLKKVKVFDNSPLGISSVGSLVVEDCNIKSKFALDNTKEIASVKLINSKFKDKFALIACDVGALSIVNSNFAGLVDFYQTRFASLQIRKSIFKDFAGFEQCVIGQVETSSAVIEMRYVTFYSFMNFRQARFNQPLDLRNTNRAQQPNFLDCSFSDTALELTDRETFRIIKQSFESVANRIEANAFYAHEMDAYRRELRQKRKRSSECFPSAEEALLWLNAQISHHGQSYWRPLCWLLATAGIFALLQANRTHHWVVTPSVLNDLLRPLIEFFNQWAKGFVIFQGLYKNFEGPAILALVVTVALSTFTWHLLVAVRLHNRR